MTTLIRVPTVHELRHGARQAGTRRFGVVVLSTALSMTLLASSPALASVTPTDPEGVASPVVPTTGADGSIDPVSPTGTEPATVPAAPGGLTAVAAPWCRTRLGNEDGLTAKTSWMTTSAPGDAYIRNGYRNDVLFASGPLHSNVPADTTLSRAISLVGDFDYFRGFYWSSRNGRWYQGSRGPQVVYKNQGARYPLLTLMAKDSEIVPGSYLYSNECVAMYGVHDWKNY